MINKKHIIVVVFMLLVLPATAAANEATGDAPVSEPQNQEDSNGSLVIERIQRERAVDDNRSVLIAHRRNYFLPVTWAREPNNEPFEDDGDFDESLDNYEAQFQVSLKLPLAEGLLDDDDAIFAGFTLKAFWQVYNNEISSPFRETNYEPEVFWVNPVPWNVFGGDATVVTLGLSHESNGRSLPNSRSWNRLYGGLIWERNRYVFYLKTWWRIPEDDKDDEDDPSGDDNPDIEDYLGNFEFTVAYRRFDHEVSVLLRNNLDSDDNRGAIQVDWTFPLQGRYRGYLQYFNGYGESLIDYDAHIERVGIGILLTDLL